MLNTTKHAILIDYFEQRSSPVAVTLNKRPDHSAGISK